MPLPDDEKLIYFAGGGTGGHLFPGISVAQAIARRRPELKPLFLCTYREIDRTILEPTGFEFLAQPIVPPSRSVGGLLKFWRSWRQTTDMVRGLLKSRRPVAVLGLGGYAAGVVVKNAAKAGVPAAILNPDVIPGKANRYLMRYTQSVCCQYAETASFVPERERGKLRDTGCPVRSGFLPLPERKEASLRLGIDPSLLTLVITGASQGAKTVNEAVLEALKSVKLQGWQVVHLSGKDHAEAVRAEYREMGLPAMVIDFAENMQDVWAVADLAISRSGASSCAELALVGVPSLLMPYPFHKDMHQRRNAQVLEAAGAAVVIDDEKDRRKNAEKLRPALESLLYDSTRRYYMHEKALSLARPDAAERVADELFKLIDAVNS